MNIDKDKQLMYSTIKIETEFGYGTCFILHVHTNKGLSPILITNRHLIEGKVLDFSLKSKKTLVSLRLHFNDGSFDIIDIIESWYLHSKYDLAFIPFHLVTKFAFDLKNIEVFGAAIPDDYLPTQNDFSGFKCIEDVIMIGYPDGRLDSYNNLPLFRKGITASHPSYDFQNESIGIVDMSSIEGSSGSPIVIWHQGSYTDNAGTTHFGEKFVLLGILFDFVYQNVESEFVYEGKTRKLEIPLKINLGRYIKSSQLKEFIDLVIMNNL